MIALHAFDLGWVTGLDDDPSDQCVHGGIELRVAGEVAFRTEPVLTVSAACLYLLRTIEDDHTPEHSVADSNWLFPCCGFSPRPYEGEYPVICMGCNQGYDVWVKHIDEGIELSWEAQRLTIPKNDWAHAVLGLVEQVEAYYRQCKPKDKVEDEYDAEGWALFWMEWDDRKQRAVRRGT